MEYIYLQFLMLPKFLRLFILLIITVFTGRATRQTQRALYSVLSFQVAGYELLLETRQGMQGVTDTVKNKVNDAKSLLNTLFDESKPWKAESINDNNKTLTEKVADFRTKIVRISRIIACVIGVVVWKMLFDAVFGLKTLRLRLKSFVLQ